MLLHSKKLKQKVEENSGASLNWTFFRILAKCEAYIQSNNAIINIYANMLRHFKILQKMIALYRKAVVHTEHSKTRKKCDFTICIFAATKNVLWFESNLQHFFIIIISTDQSQTTT